MGTKTLQISFGELQMARLGSWRSKRKYPPEKTDDSFIRMILMEQMDKEVPA